MSADTRHDVGRRYRLILDLARDITAQRDLTAVLAATFVALRQVADFGGGSIALVDDDGWIRFVATDPPATAEAMAMRIRVGDGIAGRIVETGEPVYIADIRTHPDVTPERRERSVSAGVIAYFGVPLITEGRVIGVLQIDAAVADAFTDEDRLLLLSFTPIVAAAVQNARLHAREKAALTQLQELDHRHRDFVAMVSHELRTPLTAVVGYADTILEHPEALGPSGILDLVGRARRSAGRLYVLVEELLDLSVVQRGDLKVTVGPVDLAAVIRDAIAQFAPPDATVEVSLPERLPALESDASRLIQVVGNLVSNAVKFSAPGEPVDVTVTESADDVVLTVRDRGPGVPEADRERIFDRFVQLQRANTRTSGGFGLGLYIVRQVCQGLGGEVTVDDAEGGGAVFTVTVPLHPQT